MKKTFTHFFLLMWLVLLISACKHDLTPEDARKQLGQMNISYNEASFVDSARNGDTLAVRLFLKAGMDVNARDSQGRIAYEFSDVDDYGIIGAEHANQYLGNRTLGTTALMAAAIKGRTEVVRLLLSEKPDINAKDRVEKTALDYAKLAHQDAIVELLK